MGKVLGTENRRIRLLEFLLRNSLKCHKQVRHLLVVGMSAIDSNSEYSGYAEEK
jgi:hypothetical protein